MSTNYFDPTIRTSHDRNRGPSKGVWTRNHFSGLTQRHGAMALRRFAKLSIAICAVFCASAVIADETTTYKYDAFGRVIDMSTSGGVANGVRQIFSYDSAGNVRSQQTFGPLVPRSVAIAPTSTTVGIMGGGSGAVSVNLSGNSPGGTVTFRIDDRYIGSAVIKNGIATIRIAGLSPGTYIVTATYAGDTFNDPAKLTFTVRVQDISWLPPVLELLLDN